MDELTALRRRERAIALVRWAAATFALSQVVFYAPRVPTLAAAAQRARPWGFALVALLVVAGVVAEWTIRVVDRPDPLRRIGLLLLVADVAIALAFIFVYGFDPISAQWAFLTVLPLEGAIRFQLAGAAGVAVAIVPAYLWRELQLAAQTAAQFSPGVVTYRLGLLILVALFAGVITRDQEEQRRLLQRLNDASRTVAGRLEPAEILQALCRETVSCLPARSAVVYVFDGQWFQPVAAWPPDALPRVLAEDEHEREDPALVGPLLAEAKWLARDAFHPGRLCVPIRWRGQPAAPAGEEQPGTNLVVIRPVRERMTAFQRDAAISLAELAAVAMTTTRVLTVEQRSNRRLRYLEALRTRFVATVAHDLRMPLTVFKGVARMLRNRGEEIPLEQVHEMLASVERQANRLSRLADDLLDAARLDADKLTLKRDVCDLRSVIAATAADAEEEVRVEASGDVTLVADAPRLERILWNLLSNAEKYGRPPIDVRAWREDGHVAFSVRDHGSGLAAAQRARLFSEFASSDDASSVGLGLAIVWQLVHAHGGTVRYDDAGPGARFTVVLPAAGTSDEGGT